ncbi:GNAT family N-acetyltransferase [Pseudomonas putida]|uniref:GNAT family N-acetyltransferase n=1 Tax=Pseudomonas putida TaxID=303 RepID=UPI0029C02E3F|nr:GNAT family N-acetyltransferase [Pseudomonas putida]
MPYRKGAKSDFSAITRNCMCRAKSGNQLTHFDKLAGSHVHVSHCIWKSPGGSIVSIHPLAASEWRVYRDLRLQALIDSPDAFASRYEDEAARDDSAWATRVSAVASSASAQVLIAFQQTEPCGLVWCKSLDADPLVVELFQMWVAPSSRGTGAGRALLDAAIAWAVTRDAERVCLGVTLADSPAMHLYQSSGFRPVGEPEPLRPGSALTSQPMELHLKRPG